DSSTNKLVDSNIIDDGLKIVLQINTEVEGFFSIVETSAATAINKSIFKDADGEYYIKDNTGTVYPLVIKNAEDTATGLRAIGRFDSNATVERRTQSNAGSSYAIDLNNPSGHYDLTLTDNTSI